QVRPHSEGGAVVGIWAPLSDPLEDHPPHSRSPSIGSRGRFLRAREADMAKASIDIPPGVREGYAFEGPCVELGALIVDDGPRADTKVRVPLAMLNRHGLVAGATGT